jgi:hypothetical protein
MPVPRDLQQPRLEGTAPVDEAAFKYRRRLEPLAVVAKRLFEAS